MTKWRLLDTGRMTAAENMALDEVLLETVGRKDSPNTVRFLQFSRPAVLVGYHQSVEQEARIGFCEDRGIDINRRMTGGGGIFFDESQLGWEVFCDRSFFDIPVANTRFFSTLSQPIVASLRQLGIDALFRPRNDIEVNGRKISGMGGTEDGDAFLFQGTLLTDFDVDTMLRALRIPIEKLKGKEVDSVKNRVTCLKWELGYVPTIDRLKSLLRENFEKEFGIGLTEDELSAQEQLMLKQKKTEFQSSAWIERVRMPASEQPTVCSIHRTDGGLIRTSVAVNLRRNRIQSILLTGDFFVYPRRVVFDLEAELRDIPAEMEIVEERVTRFFRKTRVEILDITPSNFVAAIRKALDKVRLTDLGIPLPLTNRIFTVNGSFVDVVRKSPRHLLLPYCAKSLACGYRYRKECPECGECSIGEAFRIGRERGMMVTTIQSFEDLMTTLDDFKAESIQSYVGCCCEAFYSKHLEDFERSGIPGILVDIDNTTCYELGKERDAYAGDFENQTEVDVSLLRRVLDVQV